MKFAADTTTCESGMDTVLWLCQSGSNRIEHEVIIHRGPREFERFRQHAGPTLSCEELGLNLVPGPENIVFAGEVMNIVMSGPDDIEVDISRLTREEQKDLKVAARELFE